MPRHFDAIIIGTGKAGPSLAARLVDAGLTAEVVNSCVHSREAIRREDEPLSVRVNKPGLATEEISYPRPRKSGEILVTGGPLPTRTPIIGLSFLRTGGAASVMAPQALFFM